MNKAHVGVRFLTMNAIILLLAIPVFASYSPRRIPLSSQLYDQVDALYVLEGLGRPSDARPWSNEEAKQIIEKIPAKSEIVNLKEKTLALLETTLPSTGPNNFSYNISTIIALEAYAHANDKDFVIQEDWIYGNDERKPVIDFRMEAQFGTTFYFGTGIEAGRGNSTKNDIKKNLPDSSIGVILPPEESSIEHISWSAIYHRLFSTNAITKETNFNGIWPRNSQINLGGSWWNISMARGPLRWGNGKSGDLIIGDHINSQNTLRFDFYGNVFKMELLYLFLEDYLDEENQRIFMGRRFEFQVLDSLRLTLTENAMFRGPSIEWKYLNPTSMYHNYYDSNKLNAIASLEATYSPCKGVLLYGQFALDQYQLPNETKTIANAAGKLVGGEFSWIYKTGVFSTSLEYVLTDPSLYRRDKVNFLLYRGQNNNGRPYIFDYLGYQYGSDSQVLRFDLSYLVAGNYKIGFNATAIRQGEVGMYYPTGDTDSTYANILGTAPSGNILSQRLIIGLQGTWWPSFAPVKLYCQLDSIARCTYTRSTNKTSDYQQDLQLIMGSTFSF